MYALTLSLVCSGSPAGSKAFYTERDYSMRWRLLRWIAMIIATAAATGLAVDVAVAGTGQAAALAGVIVGFCELTALLLGITAWVGKRQASAKAQQVKGAVSTGNTASGSETSVAKRTQDGKYEVDARWATGLQVGENNTQHIVLRSPTPGS